MPKNLGFSDIYIYISLNIKKIGIWNAPYTFISNY